MREAITIERRRLEEVRQITLADNALQSLVDQFDREKQEFEAGVARSRREWAQEEEQYMYELKMKRRKEEDAYALEREKEKAEWEAEMNKKEAGLNERAADLEKRAEELRTLRGQVEQFPAEKEDAVTQAVSIREAELAREFEHEKKLVNQRADADARMHSATEENFRQTVEAQAKEIVSLKQALADANRQTQTLASTVVENISGAKHFKSAFGDGSQKQLRQPHED